MQSKPEAKFDKTVHDFGSIKEELGAVTTMFEFTNGIKSTYYSTGFGIMWLYNSKLSARTYLTG